MLQLYQLVKFEIKVAFGKFNLIQRHTVIIGFFGPSTSFIEKFKDKTSSDLFRTSLH